MDFLFKSDKRACTSIWYNRAVDRKLDQTDQQGKSDLCFYFLFVTAAEAIPGNINPEWRAGVRSSLPEEEDDNSGMSPIITH